MKKIDIGKFLLHHYLKTCNLHYLGEPLNFNTSIFLFRLASIGYGTTECTGNGEGEREREREEEQKKRAKLNELKSN